MEMVPISKAASMLGISQQTLRTYGKEGKIKEVVTTGGHRRYLLSDIKELQGIETEVKSQYKRACCYTLS